MGAIIDDGVDERCREFREFKEFREFRITPLGVRQKGLTCKLA